MFLELLWIVVYLKNFCTKKFLTIITTAVVIAIVIPVPNLHCEDLVTLPKPNIGEFLKIRILISKRRNWKLKTFPSCIW